jgi:hypothetical protein
MQIQPLLDILVPLEARATVLGTVSLFHFSSHYFLLPVFCLSAYSYRTTLNFLPYLCRVSLDKKRGKRWHLDAKDAIFFHFFCSTN